MEFWTIEVLNGEFSARSWQDAHGDFLVEAAHTNGVLDWGWSQHEWGVVLELQFPDEVAWLRFRGLPAVGSALDAVPDVGVGLLIYSGRGGASGARVPRRPRTPPLAGAAVAPLPDDFELHDLGSRQEPAAMGLSGV